MSFPSKQNPKNNSQRDMGTNAADRAAAKAEKGHEKEGLKPGSAKMAAYYPAMYAPYVTNYSINDHDADDAPAGAASVPGAVAGTS